MQITAERTAEYEKVWGTIVTRPSIQRMSPESKQLVDNIAQIGYNHARSRIDYKKDLLQYTFRWTEEVRLKPTGYALNPVYNADVIKILIRDASAERRECEYMKRLIPVSYVLLGAIFLSLSFIFGFTFYLGLHGRNYLIGPWTNLMLFVASVGLTTTVAVAIFEWRKLQDVWLERKRTGINRPGKESSNR